MAQLLVVVPSGPATACDCRSDYPLIAQDHEVRRPAGGMSERLCSGDGPFLAHNGTVMGNWRRWIPSAKHGPARSIAVFGKPRHADPTLLADMLGTCEQLRAWARTRYGLELENIPDDLPLLDRALGEAIEVAPSELGGPARIASLGSQADLYLGTVIVATVPGAHWRLWPNGHPVVRLPSGRDADVVAIANGQIRDGSPRLASAYADAVTGPAQ